MTTTTNPTRGRAFRLVAIAASGLGGFLVGLWGIELGLAGNGDRLNPATLGAIIASLCTLAAAGATLSFFAGVDESADYVFNETQVDKLTGLHARTAMIGRIAQSACEATRSGGTVFLIDLEINRFKRINDAIGYSQGDELVKAFVARLRASLPEGVQIGRLGAGEFAILYPQELMRSGPGEVVQELVGRMARSYRLAGHSQAVTLSVGVVSIPGDGEDPAVVLRRANLALQHARMNAGESWAAFRPEMGRVAEHRQWVETEMGIALDRDDFELHYQPQLDLLTGRVVGYEALLRWRHPERGMVSPMDFIPVAEETGMIGSIGDWVLHRACSDARFLPDDCTVAVNISPVQFTARDFVAMVDEVLRDTGIPARRLELEITETAMMRDRERAARILKALEERGISVAVDDFGTGYSNLSYLIDFPFSKLKIDRSFVGRMESDSGSGAVVASIVGLSRALGVHTIAEGVETEAQATLLKAAGCEAVQGFFYGRPEPLALPQDPPRALGGVN